MGGWLVRKSGLDCNWSLSYSTSLGQCNLRYGGSGYNRDLVHQLLRSSITYKCRTAAAFEKQDASHRVSHVQAASDSDHVQANPILRAAMAREASESEFEGFESVNSSHTFPTAAMLAEKRKRMRHHFDQRLDRIDQALQHATRADAALLKGCALRLSMLSTEYETWHTNNLVSSSTAQFEQEEEEYASFENRHLSFRWQLKETCHQV